VSRQGRETTWPSPFFIKVIVPSFDGDWGFFSRDFLRLSCAARRAVSSTTRSVIASAKVVDDRVRVTHCRIDIGVTQHFLDSARVPGPTVAVDIRKSPTPAFFQRPCGDHPHCPGQHCFLIDRAKQCNNTAWSVLTAEVCSADMTEQCRLINFLRH
jgi:hypothetical protein